MRKFTTWLLIFVAGWVLSRLTCNYLDSLRSEHDQPAVSMQFKPGMPERAVIVTPGVSGNVDDIADLLQRNEFEAVVQRYESMQDNTGEAVAVNSRLQILAYARQLIAERRFSAAELLLQRYLVAVYRDVDARMLLAEVYFGQQNYSAAIDQLYETRGYAYEPVKLLAINGRIRTMVAEITKSLEASANQNALLVLYQQLTQLEPEHAPWFIGLATSQLALDDREAARRSLLLVSRDAGVGAKARAMLAKLAIVVRDDSDADRQKPLMEVVGIPLTRHGNHFVVEARLGSGRNIRLLIDTGATMTIIRPKIFEQAGNRFYDAGRTAVFNTVNGPAPAPVFILDYLAVGDWQVSQLEAGVLDLGAAPDIDGLLGMNFLMHFQFYIDQNEALLRLSVN